MEDYKPRWVFLVVYRQHIVFGSRGTFWQISPFCDIECTSLFPHSSFVRPALANSRVCFLILHSSVLPWQIHEFVSSFFVRPSCPGKFTSLFASFFVRPSCPGKFTSLFASFFVRPSCPGFVLLLIHGCRACFPGKPVTLTSSELLTAS